MVVVRRAHASTVQRARPPGPSSTARPPALADGCRTGGVQTSVESGAKTTPYLGRKDTVMSVLTATREATPYVASGGALQIAPHSLRDRAPADLEPGGQPRCRPPERPIRSRRTRAPRPPTGPLGPDPDRDSVLEQAAPLAVAAPTRHQLRPAGRQRDNDIRPYLGSRRLRTRTTRGLSPAANVLRAWPRCRSVVAHSWSRITPLPALSTPLIPCCVRLGHRMPLAHRQVHP